MSNAKHERLMDLLADINDQNKLLRVIEYHESNIYTIRVISTGPQQPHIVGSLDEAIAFTRGVKAALEVL